MNVEKDFEALRAYCRETALLEATSALLEWDERTGLPSSAGAYRADQLTHLAGLIHSRRTSPEFGELLDQVKESELAADPNSQTGAAIRKLRKDYERNARMPLALVKAISKATVLGQQAWERARADDDWKQFEPHMEEVFKLRREEAALTADGSSLYDALLDQYEEGAKSDQLTETFADLREQLVVLVRETNESTCRPTGASMRKPVSVDRQREISRWIAERVGYSFERGRLDETSHPFCTTLGPDDCRILTRYDENFFASGFYGTLHEAGHGMYEQGLPTDWYGFAPGMAAGLGIHESQSRLWENFVGRSEAFWRWGFPEVKSRAGGAWDALDAQQVYRDANFIEPSLIRVEADEVTYNLHILIRFEIEQQLMTGELAVTDAPSAWNEKYDHYLGIRPPSDKDGILQDVHWSAGLVGYFPTYTLGNLFAAQLMEAANAELGDTNEMFAKGEFEPLLAWLQDKVHSSGACYYSDQLLTNITGKSLTAEPLVRYLRAKLAPIYQL
ncbi:MAG: carboxypeptidase M32 [Aureliella sp.]